MDIVNKKISTAVGILIIVLLTGGVIFKILSFEESNKNIISLKGKDFHKNEELIFDRFGLSLSSQENWNIEVEDLSEKSSAPYGKFEFKIAPSDWDNSFWGAFYIDIYEYQPSIEDWIHKNLFKYKDDLLIDEKGVVNERKLFSLNIEKKNHLWIPRYVVLGEEYSYAYSFSQDGANDFIDVINEIIFPNIVIHPEEKKDKNFENRKESDEEIIYNKERVPTFEEFSSKETIKGSVVSANVSDIDFSTYIHGERNKETLENTHKDGPNFSGKYSVVTWGCGTMCQQISIVDLETGKVYLDIEGAQMGISFRKNSNLLIINPPESIIDLYEEGIERWETTQMKTAYYIWENEKLYKIFEHSTKNLLDSAI